MKIDEPPTPYSYLSDSEEDEEFQHTVEINTKLNAAVASLTEPSNDPCKPEDREDSDDEDAQGLFNFIKFLNCILAK